MYIVALLANTTLSGSRGSVGAHALAKKTSTTHSTYLHPSSDNSSGIPVWLMPLFLNMRMVWVGGSF